MRVSKQWPCIQGKAAPLIVQLRVAAGSSINSAHPGPCGKELANPSHHSVSEASILLWTEVLCGGCAA